MNETPFCIRCKEDMPVAKEPTQWRMGELRLLSKLSKAMMDRFHFLSEGGSKYLCGNCYFDLTDEI